jgi:SAM-dependent methyltransferase
VLGKVATRVLPAAWHEALWRRVVLRGSRRSFAALAPQEAFERIYANNLWGGAPGELCSGSGSAEAITGPYVECVRAFIASHGIRSVVDLGCGDFQVGRRIATPELQYVGVDIVRPLVQRNQERFGSASVRFECSDLMAGPLPVAELALLRQVLQHLSNAQILRVLQNTAAYRYLIVTEHLPCGSDVRPNLDKPHGPDTRLYDRSGVFLDQAPFSLHTKVLLETPAGPGEILRSVLIERAGDPLRAARDQEVPC